eukprot:139782-Pleurochrysis_carterae.AAC.1
MSRSLECNTTRHCIGGTRDGRAAPSPQPSVQAQACGVEGAVVEEQEYVLGRQILSYTSSLQCWPPGMHAAFSSC